MANPMVATTTIAIPNFERGARSRAGLAARRSCTRAAICSSGREVIGSRLWNFVRVAVLATLNPQCSQPVQETDLIADVIEEYDCTPEEFEGMISDPLDPVAISDGVPCRP
jgi:hypothetical protein